MKRLCKDVGITDRGLISRAVYACLKRKYKRNDTQKYLSQASGIEERYVRCIYKRYGRPAMRPFVEIVISELQEEIIHDAISFPPIWYREKVDGSSGKVRRIGIQNIKQQLYDYIAVEGAEAGAEAHRGISIRLYRKPRYHKGKGSNIALDSESRYAVFRQVGCPEML